jgi:hypothetical protein
MSNGNNSILIGKDELEKILNKVKEIGCDSSFYITQLQSDVDEGETFFEVEVPHKIKGIFGFFTFRA